MSKVDISKFFEGKKLNGGLLSFVLYDTYGFPFDLTKQILKENNIDVNEEDFNKYLTEQKERSKVDRVKNDNIDAKNNEIFKELALKLPITNKVFYDNNKVFCESKILAIIINNQIVNEIESNKECWIILDKTPFYPTSGGEIGDIGIISKSKVLETKKLCGEIIGHMILTNEKLKINDVVNCFSFRKNVCKNHTATHLLQAALKNVLGDNVQQKGSQVDENGLRFDFSSNKAMTSEEIKQVENIVNSWIDDYLEVKITEMLKDEAEKIKNVVKLFDEKYGEKVRVVDVIDNTGKSISTEFCGGIHCKNTGEIERFIIESEKSIGSGIRRITAITGKNQCLLFENLNNIKKQFETLKEENIKYQSTAAIRTRYESIFNMIKNRQEVNGIIFIKGKNISYDTIKIICGHLLNEYNKPIFAVASNENKNEYFCYINNNKQNNNLDCTKIAQDLISKTNGKGGGSFNAAQVIHNVKNIDYISIIKNINK